MAELLMEDETQDRNTGQMAAIRTEQEQAKQPPKPVTLNSLMMDRIDSIEGMIGSLADIATIKMLVIMSLVLGCLCLAGTVYLMTEVSFLLGRLTP